MSKEQSKEILESSRTLAAEDAWHHSKADEIERLQAEIKELRGLIRKFWVNGRPVCGPQLCEEIEKEVGDEA